MGELLMAAVAIVAFLDSTAGSSSREIVGCDSRSRSRHHPPVTCHPRTTVVEIPFPTGDLSVVQVYPSHVNMTRCLGDCAGDRSLHCRPTQTEKSLIPISVRKCPINGGKCRTYCSNRLVENHISCTCGCRTTPDECIGGKIFSERECACRCPDENLRSRCISTRNMEWRDSDCECLCSPAQSFSDCRNGLQRDAKSNCSCIDDADDVAVIDSGEGPLSPLRSPDDQAALQMLSTTISWELAAILALACLVFCLSALTVLMVRRMAAAAATTAGRPTRREEDEAAAIRNTHNSFRFHDESSWVRSSAGLDLE